MTTYELSRRGFLRRVAEAGVCLGGSYLAGPAWLRAVEPFARPAPPRLLLSLSAYSFRRDFRAEEPKERLDLFEFIDFCARHGCEGTELTSYFFEEVSSDYLRRLRRHAFLRGMPISGTAIGNNFTVSDEAKRREEIDKTKQWIERAYILGAPHIRIFAGSQSGLTQEEVRRRAVPAIEECCAHAAEHGIMLGLENHGHGTGTADGMLGIVKAVDSRWFGVNLDTGNFHTEDPYRDMTRCAPYAVNVQLKVHVNPRGKESRPVDLERVMQILSESGYQGFVALEYEASPDPWEAVPQWLGRLREAIQAGA